MMTVASLGPPGGGKFGSTYPEYLSLGEDGADIATSIDDRARHEYGHCVALNSLGIESFPQDQPFVVKFMPVLLPPRDDLPS